MAMNYRRLALSRRVVVNLQGGDAVEGILWDERGELIVIRGATLHAVGADGPQQLDGDIILERARILWTQVVT